VADAIEEGGYISSQCCGSTEYFCSRVWRLNWGRCIRERWGFFVGSTAISSKKIFAEIAEGKKCKIWGCGGPKPVLALFLLS
jgi:hypothetical protein